MVLHFIREERRPQAPPSGRYNGGLVEPLTSKFITNRQPVEIRQPLKGKHKNKYFVCLKEKGLFQGYNPQKHSKLFKDYDDAYNLALKMT